MLLEDLRVVLKVAQLRSITAAAIELDMRSATASAALKRVERKLGVALFIRTTRHLRPTSAGEKYFPHCEQALLLLDQAKQNMHEDMAMVEGELRLAVSSDLGRNMVIPWLDEFLDQHPKVSLRSHISDSNLDFYRDSVDLALRYGSPSDANLYGFKICKVPRLLCASPAYLQQHGNPQHLQQLSAHNGLFYQLHDVIHDVWQFSHQGLNQKIKMTGNRAANDGDLVRRWCVAGKGIAAKSSLDMADDLLHDRVVSLLPQYQPSPTELWLICPSRQSITPAVRLLRDMLKQKCAELLQQLIDKGVLTAQDIYD